MMDETDIVGMPGSGRGYAALGAQAQKCAGNAIRKETALDRLSDHANTAGRIGDIIESFLGRCKGSEGDCANGSLTTVPTGHFAQLERLERLLARAEELARELGNIG
jgi:hypothetical protein